MFYKKEKFITNLNTSELEDRFLKFYEKQFDGEVRIDNNSFYMKRFSGFVFQAYVVGDFIELTSNTEVNVEYKVDLWLKIVFILSMFCAPLVFIYLKVFDKYIIGTSPSHNLDFFILIAPVFAFFVLHSMFNNEYNRLRKNIHSICQAM